MISGAEWFANLSNLPNWVLYYSVKEEDIVPFPLVFANKIIC